MIYLDVTPAYIFNTRALSKIAARNLPCFFILRPYDDFNRSISRYLEINQIKKTVLERISEEDYQSAMRFVSEHFPVFTFEDVNADPTVVIRKIETDFGLDLGDRSGENEFWNDSAQRLYYCQSILASQIQASSKIANSLEFGVI